MKASLLLSFLFCCYQLVNDATLNLYIQARQGRETFDKPESQVQVQTKSYP